MGFARQPNGYAIGALAGSYPAPAMGLPTAIGMSLWDEFFAPKEIVPSERVENRFGDLLWAHVELGGGTTTFNAITPTTFNEVGILSAQTATQTGRGMSLFLSPVPPFFRHPPAGTIWACKIRMVVGVASYELWSGFATDEASRVATADASGFIGVRSTGGNLFGVCKSGAGAETVVDLGVSCNAGVWRIVGFEIQNTNSAPRVQFFIIDPIGTSIEQFDRQDVGDPITTNLPTAPTQPIGLALVTTTNASRTAEIDFWCLGGRTTRR